MYLAKALGTSAGALRLPLFLRLPLMDTSPLRFRNPTASDRYYLRYEIYITDDYCTQGWQSDAFGFLAFVASFRRRDSRQLEQEIGAPNLRVSRRFVL